MQRYLFKAVMITLMLFSVSSFTYAACMACHQAEPKKENPEQNSLKKDTSTPIDE